MTDPFDEFPQTLDLLAALVPSQTEYVTKQGRRIFVTVIEYWTLRTSVRFTLPFNDFSPGAGLGSVTDDDGTDYGVSGSGGGSTGVVAAWDGHISTKRPIPQSVKRLHISTGLGQDFTVEI